MSGVEQASAVNLSVGNMSLFDWADSVDQDGVFRGFGG